MKQWWVPGKGGVGLQAEGQAFVTMSFELLQTPQSHLNWFSWELCKTPWHPGTMTSTTLLLGTS